MVDNNTRYFQWSPFKMVGIYTRFSYLAYYFGAGNINFVRISISDIVY